MNEELRQHIEYLRIAELKPYPRNPRTHSPAQVERIAASMREFGFTNPVLVNVEGEVIAGHGRLLAAQRLGMGEVPAIRLEHLTPAQVRAYRLADNQLTLLGDWDEELLSGEVQGLADEDFDLGVLGFGEEELAGLLGGDGAGEGDLDEGMPEPPAKPVTSEGDLWLMGKHRLLCGDAAKQSKIARLTGSIRARMLLTDPPYGIKRDKGFGGVGKPIARRRYEGAWDGEIPKKETFEILLGLAEESFIFGGNYFAHILPQSKHWIVWDKKNTMPTFGDAELVWTNVDRTSVKIKRFEFNGLIGKERERYHPTQKPVALLAEIICDYSKGGDTVLDPFIGSGSTLIAAEGSQRICFGIEIDSGFCDVAVRRWEGVTGKQAVLEGDGRTFGEVAGERGVE